MGFGFYGRGFTMTDTQCHTPPSCTFSGPGFPGDCTNEPGILSYSGKLKPHLIDTKQRLTYDSRGSGPRETIEFSEVLRQEIISPMIWELGLDTGDFQALSTLFGDEAVGDALRDTSLNPG